MKSFEIFSKTLLMSLIILLVISPETKCQGKSGRSSSGNKVMLAYNPPAGKVNTYSMTTAVTQTMEVEGQSVNVFINTNLGYDAKLIEKIGENLNYEITVKSLSMNIDAMGNTTGRDISEVAGKSFKILVAGTGKVVDASEAGKIEYSVEGQGNVNLGETFRSVFPVLPGKIVRPGDSWVISDTMQNQTAGSRVYQVSEISGKYEGNEKFNGIDCAKIVSEIKGTMETTTNNQGMDVYLHGPVTGSSIIYFSLKDGLVVKEEVTSMVTGTVQVSGPMEMSIPVVMDIVNKLELK